MNRRKLVLLLALLPAALAFNCAHCDGQGELLRRYDTHAKADWQGATNLVEVSAFVTDVPAAARSPMLLSLDPTAQDDAIRALSRLGPVKTADDIIAVLSKPLGGGGGGSSSLVDRTRFSKRLVVSALRSMGTRVNPADRIDELLVTVKLTNPESKFVSWNRFSTQEEEVDLGKITLKKTSQTQLQVAGNAAAAGVPVEASATQTFGREQNEEVQLSQRRVQLAGVLKEREAQIYQQGIRGVDLTGTAQIDLVMRVTPGGTLHPVSEIGSLKDKDGDWQEPGKLSVVDKRIRVPQNGVCEVKATVDGDYRVLQATSNDRTYSEGDDTAVYQRGSVAQQTITVLDKSQLEVVVFRLVDSGGYALAMDGISRANRGEIWFLSEAAAAGFLEWLTEADHARVRSRKLWMFDPAAIADVEYTANDAAKLAVSPFRAHACP